MLFHLLLSIIAVAAPYPSSYISLIILIVSKDGNKYLYLLGIFTS